VRLSHIPARTSAVFDDPNLVSHGGLVPVMALAERAGLPELLADHVRPGGECGVNAPLKVGCLVAGMAAGADSIHDMGLLRHGAMDVLSGGVRAPSTPGSHLRAYAWGNVLQIEKAGRELLTRLSREAPLLPGAGAVAFIDIDSTQKRVYGHKKEGARFGHTKIQGKSVLVRARDRRHQAARRQRPLVPRRGQPRRPGHRDRPRLRLHRDHRRPDGLRLLRRHGDRRGPPQRSPVLRHRPGQRRRPGRDRRHPR
jgi:hypothetical protein